MRGYDLQLVSLYTPRKRKTRNVRGIVHIWFLISNKLYLKWALVQSSPKILIFLCMMGFFTVLENFVDFWGRGVNIAIQIKCLPHFFMQLISFLVVFVQFQMSCFYPLQPPPLLRAPKVDMLLIGNIWQ